MSSNDQTRPDTAHQSIQRSPDVEKRTGVCLRTLHRWEARGLFPRRVVLGPNSVGYYTHEVDAWIASRQRQRDHARPSPNPRASQSERTAD